MKKMLLTLLAAIFAVNAQAAPVQKQDIDFQSPIVNDRNSLTDLVPAGTIVFDINSGGFWGLSNTAAWQQMSVPAVNDEVILYGQNGFGATATKIRRFANLDVNTGSAITYADDSNNGVSFTINADGMYSISYTDLAPAAGTGTFGISLNASGGDLTTNVENLAAAKIVQFTQGFNGANGNMSVTLRLQSGDVLRPHSDGTLLSTGSTSYPRIRVMRVF